MSAFAGKKHPMITVSSHFSRYRRDTYTLGVSFYSCVFGFLVFESLAVLLMQNSGQSGAGMLEKTTTKPIALGAHGQLLFSSDVSTPDIMKPIERRKSFTHIGAFIFRPVFDNNTVQVQ